MKSLTVPVISKEFIEKTGKTVVTVFLNGKEEGIWVNGDQSANPSLLVNITINEVGDTFLAKNDSKKFKEDGKTPLYKAGETVTRQNQSIEYRSFQGANQAANFAQAANAYGLQLVVQM
jgi:hypothetical protein